MFGFQKLEVYKKAKQFHIDCKDLLTRIKTTRNVIDQLTRSSSSVPYNIAEGSGKFSKPDRKNYFITARASVFESVAILDGLDAEGKINKNEFAELNDTCDQMSRMLYRMIKNLEG